MSEFLSVMAPFPAGVFLLTIVGGAFSIHVARRIGAMDHPNERSSHVVPTPRMGGVPMVVAVLIGYAGWAALVSQGVSGDSALAYTLLFATGMSFLGFLDDLSELSPFLRLAAQLALVFFLVWRNAGLFPSLQFGPLPVPAAAVAAMGGLWAVWMLNLYNFMDGIDGLASGEAILASTFFFFLFLLHGEPAWATANLFIAAAAAGFFVLNRPPARIFMGDAGSFFLGGFYGFQSVIAALTTAIPFPVFLLPFANFILDTTITLIRRIWCGEKWYVAHRSHFYQRMTNLGMSHGRVTFLELSSAVVCCLASAIYLESGLYGRAVVLALVLTGFIAEGIRFVRWPEIKICRRLSPGPGKNPDVPHERDKTRHNRLPGRIGDACRDGLGGSIHLQDHAEKAGDGH